MLLHTGIEKAKVSGWGKTSITDTAASAEHQVAQITFVKRHTCGRYWAAVKNVTENMLCARAGKLELQFQSVSELIHIFVSIGIRIRILWKYQP